MLDVIWMMRDRGWGRGLLFAGFRAFCLKNSINIWRFRGFGVTLHMLTECTNILSFFDSAPL